MRAPRLNFKRLAALGLIAALLSGCSHRLPNIKADAVSTRTSTLGVVQTAEASGISITDTYVTAAEAKWTLSFPGFDHTTVATNYRQRREKEEKEAATAKP